VLQAVGGSQYGGAVAIIASYVRELQAKGCEVVVNSSVPRVAKAISGGQCEVVSIPELRRPINPLADVIATIKFAWLCRRRRFDVVHTHTSKTGIVGRLAARLAGVPVILHTAHGFAFHERSSRLSVALYAFVERLAAHWCDRIVVVSDFHRQWAIELGIARPEKFVTIHNGLAAERIHPRRSPSENRHVLGLTDGARVIGVFGRLTPQKGLETLIDAMPIVVARVPSVRLLLVGEGPLLNDLRGRIGRLGLSANVSLIGFRDDVPDLISICEVVISSSLWEGLSVSVLEAMGQGRPIVATRIASNRELLGEGSFGLLVPPGDSSALGEGIITLLSDRQGAGVLGERARMRFLEEFTEERMQSSLWKLYAELLGDPHPFDASRRSRKLIDADRAP
jgi:glycosyltransferase involved in cell wall biosynthesis